MQTNCSAKNNDISTVYFSNTHNVKKLSMILYYKKMTLKKKKQKIN